MPVIVTASASQRLPKRPRTKSAARDVVVLVADVPEPRKHQEQDRIDHDRVGHREERDRAGAERQRRDGDEGVGGVEIAADQEPGDDGAEAPAAEPPFMQLVEVALAPMRGGKAEPGDEAEQQRRRWSARSSSRPARINALPRFASILVGHDLRGKPVATFPDHVLRSC